MLTPLFPHTPHSFLIVQFKDIQFAYEVLSDPEKRERYDHFGMAGVTDDAAGPSEYTVVVAYMRSNFM